MKAKGKDNVRVGSGLSCYRGSVHPEQRVTPPSSAPGTTLRSQHPATTTLTWVWGICAPSGLFCASVSKAGPQGSFPLCYFSLGEVSEQPSSLGRQGICTPHVSSHTGGHRVMDPKDNRHLTSGILSDSVLCISQEADFNLSSLPVIDGKWSEVAQSCPTLGDPMDCCPPGSSVHGISQETVLEWVAIPFSRGSSQPMDRIWVFCIAGRHFTFWAHQGGPW